MTIERVFLEGGCCGDSSSLSSLWEENRFFWHQWDSGRDGWWCGVRGGMDRRRLLWMTVFCSTLQQAYTCSHSRLDSHIYYLRDAYCMCAHIHKVHTLASSFVEKVKMCGNYVCVATGVAGSCIYHDWNLLLPCAPDMLRSESSPHTSQLVFLLGVLGTLSSCWLLKMDRCSCAVTKGTEWRDWLKKYSAVLVLNGHLFHPTNSTDSKYMT